MTLSPSRARILAALYAVAFLSVAFMAGVQHDYEAYVRIWSRMLGGGEPWVVDPVALQDNSYGPLFTVFAPWLELGPTAPRVLFALAWLGGQWLVIRRLRTGPAPLRPLWLAIMALNPFPWVWIAVHGSNDAVVAFLFAIAVCSRLTASTRGVGAAFAALLKYYPLLLLPFMCIDRGSVKWRPLLIGLTVFLTGMVIAFATWGPMSLWPLLTVEDRAPKLLSIYAFLQDSTLVPALGLPQDPPIRSLSLPMFALIGLTGICFHVWSRQSWLNGTIFGYFLVLLTYHVGHFQFYLPLVLIFPVYVNDLLEHHHNSAEARRTVFAGALALTYVSILGAAYWLLGGYVSGFWLLIRQNCGLPAFILNAVALAQLARMAIMHRADQALPGR